MDTLPPSLARFARPDPDAVDAFSIERHLPALDAIPEPFRWGATEQNHFVAAWIEGTLPGDIGFIPREGIDVPTALDHLRAILGRDDIPLDHLSAAAALLCTLWFEEIRNMPATGKAGAESPTG